MAKQLEGKIAIITGGNSGIGLATVQLLLSQGAKVASIDITPPPSQEEVTKNNENLLAIQCDITSETEVNDAVKRVIEKWGDGVDILANVAGRICDMKGVHSTSLEIWHKTLAVNLTGPMFLLRAVLPHMLQKPYPNPTHPLGNKGTKGSIINICSTASIRGSAAGAAYTSSKHALLGLSRNTAWMYRKEGIRCNAVFPGGVMTGIVQNSDSGWDYREESELTDYMRCQNGISEAGSVAGVVLFLAGEGAEAVNGAEISVDRGWSVA